MTYGVYERAWPLFRSDNLSLGKQVSLLGTGTERRLLACRLKSMTLQNALEGLRRRALAGATTTGRHGTGASLRGGHCRCSRVSGRSRHFV